MYMCIYIRMYIYTYMYIYIYTDTLGTSSAGQHTKTTDVNFQPKLLQTRVRVRCVLEAWESVMMCKTQITDLYMVARLQGCGR